jgi:hypothetical protein
MPLQHGETLVSVIRDRPAAARSVGRGRARRCRTRRCALKPNSSIRMPDTTSIPVNARTNSDVGEMSPKPSVVIVATL